MSKISLSPNVSGTGTLTIAAPNTNNDITLNLPTTMGTNNSSSVVTTNAAGNLGLGVTPSATGASYKSFELGFAGIGLNARSNATLDVDQGVYWTAGSAPLYASTGVAAAHYRLSSGTHAWYNAPSGTAGAAISFTQAMTLDASGNLMVGTTIVGGRQTVYGGTGQIVSSFRTKETAGTYCQFVYNDVNQIGTITGTTTATAYNTSSDYRLKENIAPMTGALAKVAALKPVTYTWKADDSAGEGFIAHELAEVCPAAVTGDKDAVDDEGKPQYQGIDVSFLVGTLTAAIQELKAIVDGQAILISAQGAEIATLKGTA